MIEKIISGGQTGADEAALEWAIQRNIPHEGWCPCGRNNERGLIDPKFQLKETPLQDVAQRTERNVKDSDGTAIFSIAPELGGGSLLTAKCCDRYQKPCLHLNPADGVRAAAQKLDLFIKKRHIKILNIAGPRASEEPEIGIFVREVLDALRLKKDCFLT